MKLRIAFLIVLWLCFPRHASGQTWTTGWLAGGAVVVQSKAVPEFSELICPGAELGAELNAHILPLRWLGVGIFGRALAEVERDRCVNGFHPPPPDSGTLRRTVFPDQGYPYMSTGLRVTAFSGTPYGGALRLFAGGEWLPAKEQLVPIVGGGGSTTVGEMLLLVELETRFLQGRQDVVTTEYRNGQPISTTREQRTENRPRWALRIGVEMPVRR